MTERMHSLLINCRFVKLKPYNLSVIIDEDYAIDVVIIMPLY